MIAVIIRLGKLQKASNEKDAISLRFTQGKWENGLHRIPNIFLLSLRS